MTKNPGKQKIKTNTHHFILNMINLEQDIKLFFIKHVLSFFYYY